MRSARIGWTSYTIAALLLAVVVAAAWMRSRPADAPAAAIGGAHEQNFPAAPQAPDEAAWHAACAGCHGAGEARGRKIPALRGEAVTLFTAAGGRGYLLELMLTGKVRAVDDGRATDDPTHPSYAALSDPEVAGILNHMLTSWGNEALLPAEARLYTADEVAARR